ncbi:MAG: hypothetical protein K2Z81_13130, partial [Cyanobacteria bacterium]|nr:hypothetical protein [Cyanobacteriota bacterium]
MINSYRLASPGKAFSSNSSPGNRLRTSRAVHGATPTDRTTNHSYTFLRDIKGAMITSIPFTFEATVTAATTLSCGEIAKITMPSGFIRGQESHGGMGNNWNIPFSPPDGSPVEIALFYRGSPETSIDTTVFRDILSQNPHVVFEQESPQSAIAPEMAKVVTDIRHFLGNAGNNQITNQEEGIGGPRFFLERIETIDLNGRPVLGVHGFFHSYK